MDLCLDTVVQEVFLKIITPLTENGEDMIDAVAGRLNYSHEGIAYFSLIAGSNLLTTLIGGIKILQFHTEHSSLQFVNTRVAPLIVVNIFLMTAIVAEGADDVSKLFVVSCHGSCIAQRTEVLAWVEAVGGGIA